MLKLPGESWMCSALGAFSGQGGVTPYRALTSDVSGVFYNATTNGDACNDVKLLQLA